MRVAETVAAIVVALLGATTIALARRLPYEAEYGPGPGFLPIWLGGALVVLSLFLLYGARQKPRDDAGTGGAEDTPSRFWQFAPGALVPWAVFTVCTVAVSLLFERLGFALSIGVFMLVTMRWVARQSWPSTVIFAIVTPLVLYLGFVRILMVPLPLAPSGF